MWTVIWTLLVFVLLLFHGDSILAFAAEQLRASRAHRLDLLREKTKQTVLARQRDELVWRELVGPDQPPCPPTVPEQPKSIAAAPSTTPIGEPPMRTQVRVGYVP